MRVPKPLLVERTGHIVVVVGRERGGSRHAASACRLHLASRQNRKTARRRRVTIIVGNHVFSNHALLCRERYITRKTTGFSCPLSSTPQSFRFLLSTITQPTARSASTRLQLNPYSGHLKVSCAVKRRDHLQLDQIRALRGIRTLVHAQTRRGSWPLSLIGRLADETFHPSPARALA